jgi:hypothetical protein
MVDAGFPAPNVFGVRYGFKVFGVYAKAISAEMI